MPSTTLSEKKLREIVVGDWVQVTPNPNSQQFLVVERNGRIVGLAYYVGKRLTRTQYFDHTIIKRKVKSV